MEEKDREPFLVGQHELGLFGGGSAGVRVKVINTTNDFEFPLSLKVMFHLPIYLSIYLFTLFDPIYRPREQHFTSLHTIEGILHH